MLAEGVGADRVNIFAAGVMVGEAMKAKDLLAHEDVAANVINVTSPDRLFQRYQSMTQGLIAGAERDRFLNDVVSPEAALAPVVSVIDGHPQALAWLGGALGV